MNRAAAVFAGQGAQAVGMGADLAATFPECRELFERADAALGFSLSGICFEGPESELTETRICQPAIFVVSAACLAAYKALRPSADFGILAGLSLGEWTALYAAGVLGFEQTLRILEARGRFMQEACDETPGGMISVMRLPADKVREIAEASGLTVANLNSAEQIVLSGSADGVAAAAGAVKAAGGRGIVLRVAGAYHSPLMASAAVKLEETLAGETFREPAARVLSNVTGRPHGDAASIKKAMLEQVTGSVLWLDSVEYCVSEGVDTFVEFGPGKTLTGLIKRIAPHVNAVNISDEPQARSAAELD